MKKERKNLIKNFKTLNLYEVKTIPCPRCSNIFVKDYHIDEDGIKTYKQRQYCRNCHNFFEVNNGL